MDTAQMARDIEASLDADLGTAPPAARPANVRQFPVPNTTIEAENALRRFHRNKITENKAAAAARRKKAADEVERLEAERKRIKAVYEADMKALAERIADAKAQGEDEAAAADRMVASSRAALTELAAE
jgi:hypothetical protein